MNTVSAKITLGSTLAGLTLLVIIGVVVITGSEENKQATQHAHQAAMEAEEQSKNNMKSIHQINATLTDFIKDRNIAFNKTFEQQDKILNATHSLTSEEYNKAAEKKVENILGNMSEEHELIFKALNITKTESPDEKEQLGQLLKDFIQSNKEKAHEPQRPKVK